MWCFYHQPSDGCKEKRNYFFVENFPVVFVRKNSFADGNFLAISSSTARVKSPLYFSSAIAWISATNASGKGIVFRIRLAARSRGLDCFFMLKTVTHYLTVCNGDKSPQHLQGGNALGFCGV